MPKSGVRVAVRRQSRRLPPADLSNAVEGQIAEICRDLTLQLKRMRQLQEQADELCMVIRQWAGGSEAVPSREPPIRGGRH